MCRCLIYQSRWKANFELQRVVTLRLDSKQLCTKLSYCSSSRQLSVTCHCSTSRVEKDYLQNQRYIEFFLEYCSHFSSTIPSREGTTRKLCLWLCRNSLWYLPNSYWIWSRTWTRTRWWSSRSSFLLFLLLAVEWDCASCSIYHYRHLIPNHPTLSTTPLSSLEAATNDQIRLHVC